MDATLQIDIHRFRLIPIRKTKLHGASWVTLYFQSIVCIVEVSAIKLSGTCGFMIPIMNVFKIKPRQNKGRNNGQKRETLRIVG